MPDFPIRFGYIEGKFGGGADLLWEDWGFVNHPVEFKFTIRDAYNDLEDEDLDENVRGPMASLYARTALWPDGDHWVEKIFHSFKVTAGVSRIQDDPEFFIGISLEFVEEDVRTLIGLASAGT